jgi:hypothetical protein
MVLTVCVADLHFGQITSFGADSLSVSNSMANRTLLPTFSIRRQVICSARHKAAGPRAIKGPQRYFTVLISEYSHASH